MINVLHVIGPLGTGGAQTQLFGLVKAAHGELWNASVLATSGGVLEPMFEELDCDVTVLRRRSSPGLLRIAQSRRIARERFDVVHGNLWQSNAYTRMAVVGRRKRPAVVISERNVEAGRSQLRRGLDKLLAPVTDAYVGNTEAVSEFIRLAHPVTDQQVVTIPNGIDRAIFAPRGPRAGNGPLRVGSVGRLDHEKGFDVLIEATRLLTSTLEDDVEVEVAGDGALMSDLRAAAEGTPVKFIGRLDAGEPVADFLRSLDVFVLPSRFREGRPNVILEATACGTPVVATDIPGMGEILARDTLAAPGDARSLAESITEAAADPEQWKQRSNASPAAGFEALAEQYLAVFEAAIQHARTRSS